MIAYALLSLLVWAPWTGYETKDETVRSTCTLLIRLAAMIACYAIVTVEVWAWIVSVLT